MTPDQQIQYHAISPTHVLESLGSSQETGLSDSLASTRLSQAGLNEISEHREKGLWKTIWEQLTAVLVLLLLAAAAKQGIHRNQADEALPRTREAPFDSVRKRMSPLHKVRNAHQIPKDSIA